MVQNRREIEAGHGREGEKRGEVDWRDGRGGDERETADRRKERGVGGERDGKGGKGWEGMVLQS